jgi:hypothetical protein
LLSLAVVVLGVLLLAYSLRAMRASELARAQSEQRFSPPFRCSQNESGPVHLDRLWATFILNSGRRKER